MSMTKLITSIGLLQLIEQGKLTVSTLAKRDLVPRGGEINNWRRIYLAMSSAFAARHQALRRHGRVQGLANVHWIR